MFTQDCSRVAQAGICNFIIKMYKILLWYFDPVKFVYIMKINNFRGDTTDISGYKKSHSCIAEAEGVVSPVHAISEV